MAMDGFRRTRRTGWWVWFAFLWPRIHYRMMPRILLRIQIRRKIYQGYWRRWRRVRVWLAHSNQNSRVFNFQDIVCLFLIKLFAYYNNELSVLAEWLGKACIVHWDLGSNPRSPKLLIIILSQVFRCASSSVIHHTLAKINAPDGL